MLIGLPNAGKSTISRSWRTTWTHDGPDHRVTMPVKLKIEISHHQVIWEGKSPTCGGSTTTKSMVPSGSSTQRTLSNWQPARAPGEGRPHEMLKGKPILVMANKQDMPQALSESDIAIKMGFTGVDSNSAFANTDFSIKKCTALPTKRGDTADPALMEGVKWLVTRIGGMYDKINARVVKDVQQEKEKAAIEKKAREERVAKLKEERRKAKEAAEKNGGNPIKAKAPKPQVSFPCTVTANVKTELFCVDNGDGVFRCQNPAVKKSGLWNWKPVCQQCEDYLKAKQGEQVKLVKPTAEQEAANKEAKDKEDAEIAQAKENAEPENQR